NRPDQDVVLLDVPAGAHLPEQREDIREDVGDIISNAFSSEPRWGPYHYSQLATKALEEARLVLWWMPKRQQFSPAAYCPNLKTAIFLKGLLGNIRVCPRCGKLFIAPKRNILYDKIQCREAHRLERWREQKKRDRG